MEVSGDTWKEVSFLPRISSGLSVYWECWKTVLNMEHIGGYIPIHRKTVP